MSDAMMLDAALSYAARGIPVFPVWPVRDGACACGDPACLNPGKHPLGLCAPHGFLSATTDDAILRTWWTRFPDANIATPTGHWCCVLDLDPRHHGGATLAGLEHQHGALPLTAQVLSGGHGRHFYFAPVPGLSGTAVGSGLEVKAAGGYIIVPPSNHLSGRRYADDPEAPLFETPLAAMPAWLLQLARGPNSDGWLSVQRAPFVMPEKIVAGHRHLAIFKLIRSLKGKGLSLGAVWKAIVEENAARCEPPLADAELDKFFGRAWRQKDRAGFTGSDYAAEAPTGQDETPSADDEARPFVEPLGQFLARIFPSPHPIIEGLLSDEGGGFIAGEEKLGKSFWSLDEALAIALGQPVAGAFTVPARRRVLFIEEEDPPRRVHRRLRALLRGRGLDPDDPAVQADLDAWFHVVAWQGFTFDTRAMIERLEAELTAHRPAVTYVDVLRKVTLKDLNKADQAGTLLAELDRLRRAHNTAFRLLHHYRKVQGARAGRGSQEIGGSFVLGAWIENALYFEPVGRQQGQVRVSVQSKDLEPVAAFRMRLESEGEAHDPTRVRIVAVEEAPDAAAAQLDDVVLQCVATLPVSIPDEGEPGVSVRAIADHLKRSKDTVQRSLNRLIDAGRVRRTGTQRRSTVLYGVKRP
jgi:hypothetical protein